jgi:hypothetical protein
MSQRYATASDLPPEFADADPDAVAYWLDFTKSYVNLAAWGDRASKGHAMAAAHYLSLAGQAGAGSQAAAVKSEAVGQVSVTYATPEQSDTEWGRTGYGSIFVSLREGLALTPFVARSNSFSLGGLRR